VRSPDADEDRIRVFGARVHTVSWPDDIVRFHVRLADHGSAGRHGFSISERGDDTQATRWLFECPSAESAAEWVEELYPLGVILFDFHGRYEMERVLAQGGTAKVYLAQHLETHQATVIKVAVSDIGKTMIVREAELLLCLNHHRVVRMFGLHEFAVKGQQSLALALEYMDGGDLRQWVRDTGMPEDEAREIFLQLAEGVEFLHRHGVVHRDIKPANILVAEHNYGLRCKIADLGLGCFLRDAEELRVQRGSPGFCAPEVLRGHPASCKSDIFGLGVLLHFLLTGHTPFEADTVHEVLRLNRKGFQHMVCSEDVVFSADALELMEGLCHSDPELRWTARTVLGCRWLNPERPRAQSV
jgi:serine/threonine protein kinase